MQSEDRIRVQHILDEAGEACKYVEGISFNKFAEDGKTVRAVILILITISFGRQSKKICRL